MFDTVILDLTVASGIGGKDLLKKLLEIDPKAKVVASSGDAVDHPMSELIEMGFSRVIAKPYTAEYLSRTLSELLTRGSE